MNTNDINQAYKQNRQDIYNVLDLLKEELQKEDNNINWGHVGSLGHIRSNLVETYSFACNTEPEDINQKLEQYRQTNTYPTIKDDLEQLLERIDFCEIESSLAEEGGDVSLSMDRRCTGQYLADVFNTANKGEYAEAFKHAKELPLLAVDYVPQRLYDFLSQYE